MKLKTSWIKALYHSTHKIYSSKQSLNKQISQIKTYMSWNGYPKRVRNSVIKRLEKKRSRPRLTDDDRKKIWLNLPYNEKLGEKLSIEQTNYFCFCPTKDRISRNQKAHVIYIIQFFGCHNDNVGKTDRNLVTRLLEHGKKEDQPMF